MEIERYKKLAKIIGVSLIVLVCISFFIIPNMNKKPNNNDNNKKNEGISTGTPFKPSNYDNGKLVQDYLNPTDEEIGAVIDRYGLDNFKFTDQGLYVYALNDDEENRLYTDVWIENKFLDMIVKPELEIFLIEIGDTYLVINLENVDEKDLKKYIKTIEDEYSRELYSRHSETIYRAANKKEMLVDIKFYPETEKAVIRYEI